MYASRINHIVIEVRPYMVENDLDRILEELARKLVGKGDEKSMKQEQVELDIVDVNSPHGIYIYDKEKDKWVLVRTEGEAFKPEEDGVYVIYFDNTRCPACRIYDLSWYPYIKLVGRNLENVKFIIILCSWFARNCESEAAKNSFKEYDVHASPTTYLLYVKNGEVVLKDKLEGSKPLDVLTKKIDEFLEKVREQEEKK